MSDKPELNDDFSESEEQVVSIGDLLKQSHGKFAGTLAPGKGKRIDIGFASTPGQLAELQRTTSFKCPHGIWVDIRVFGIFTSLPAEWDIYYPLAEGECALVKYESEMRQVIEQAIFCHGCMSWKSRHNFTDEQASHPHTHICSTCIRRRRM